MPTTETSAPPGHGAGRNPTGALSALVREARQSAERWHRGQLGARGTPYIDHPVEVAQLLSEFGGSQTVNAAGLLHDVLEKTDATERDLERRFGAEVGRLVASVSDRDPSDPYRRRKRDLRARVARAGGDTALIFAADSVSKVRGLRRLAEQAPERLGPDTYDGDLVAKLEHYDASAAMLRRVAGGHPLVALLREELAAYRSRA